MLKTKYLLPLILILLLTFTLVGYSADLFGTYDQRIKFTIDNTKIDAELTWIPITTFFTAAQAEEIFAEFDSDDDFDRGAFTKADESTQLFADCELFDDSESKGIYHVSRDGWVIANGADTDYYFYYDKDAAHNTTYISMSGNTAAQSVYDGNYKGVWHKNDITDANIAYDTKYEATVEPDSDGWTLGGTDYSSVSAGILTIDTMSDNARTCYYYKTPDVDFDGGFYLKTRVKASSDMNAADDRLDFYIKDGTLDRTVRFGIENGAIYYVSAGVPNRTAVATTDDYHIYELYVEGAIYKIYQDGVEKVSATRTTSVADDLVQFGDPQPDLMCKAEIDYVYYAIEVRWNPAIDTTILDSTSNANDGTKKAANEPVEAAGKVGQGQSFDGADDYINLGQPADLDFGSGNFTISMLAKSDTNLILYDSGAGGATFAYLWMYYDGAASVFRSDDGTDASSITNDLAGYIDDDWHMVTYQRDGNNTRAYVDSSQHGIDTDCTDVDSVDSGRDTWIGRSDYGRDVADEDWHTGEIDEFRASNSVRSAAWDKATYNTLWDTLLTYGSEETAPVITNVMFMFSDF